MYQTVATYISDGTQRDFAVPFIYIKREYVNAYSEELDSKGRVVGERQPLSFSWLNSGMVRLNTVVPAGYRITVERETYADRLLVDFQDAAIVTEQDLDLATLQSLHVAQEARDRNGYEIVEASHNVMIAVDEVKEYAERAEDAAADSEQNLQECEAFATSAEKAKQDALAAKRDAQTLRDSIADDVVLIQQKADAVAQNTDTVERLAAEVAANTLTVRGCTEEVRENTDKVENWTTENAAANTSALAAADRAEHAAAQAEAAAGVDLSLYVEKSDFDSAVSDLNTAVDTKADSTEMTTALAGKSDTGHRHAQGDITGLAAALDEKANTTDLKDMAKVNDAPSDGTIYGRQDGSWVGVEDPAPFPLTVGQVTPYFGAIVDKSAFEPNFLYADGRAVSRTQHPELFAAYGTIHGAGDGASTFNLPDLRGVFVRGLDEGRGLDPGRSLGGFQGDAIRNATGHFIGISSGAKGAFYTGAQSGHTWGGSGLGHPQYQHMDLSRVVPTADENRPINMACHWFIVAQSPAVASSGDFTAAVNAVNASLDTVRAELDQKMAQILHVQEQQPSGTNAGTFTSGAWRTRGLNIPVFNSISGALLSDAHIREPLTVHD